LFRRQQQARLKVVGGSPTVGKSGNAGQARVVSRRSIVGWRLGADRQWQKSRGRRERGHNKVILMWKWY
jgi:hypothetical protein